MEYSLGYSRGFDHSPISKAKKSFIFQLPGVTASVSLSQKVNSLVASRKFSPLIERLNIPADMTALFKGNMLQEELRKSVQSVICLWIMQCTSCLKRIDCSVAPWVQDQSLLLVNIIVHFASRISPGSADGSDAGSGRGLLGSGEKESLGEVEDGSTLWSPMCWIL